jgi:hypothetical protein
MMRCKFNRLVNVKRNVDSVISSGGLPIPRKITLASDAAAPAAKS